MFRPFYAFIGARYVLLQKKNHAIAFFSLVSIIGIALGVMVLITVTSVMNGFSREIRAELLSGEPHIVLAAYGGNLGNWPQVADKILKNNPSQVQGTAPFVLGQGMLNFNGINQGIMIQGIEPAKTNTIFPLKSKMVTPKNLIPLISGKYNILLGEQLANRLRVNLGDKLTLMIPETNISPVGVTPRMKQFTVTGIFDITVGFNLSHALIDLADSQRLFQLQNNVTGLQINLFDPLSAPTVVNKISQEFNNEFFLESWMDKHGTYLKAIKMEKTVMTVILLLIIAVAAFNLISSLVMMVADKQADISMLRSMGANPRQIMLIFVVQGCLIGFLGISLGVIGGVVLASNITAVAEFIQSLMGTELITKELYYLNYLPSEIHWQDISMVTVSALILSVLATIYPAYRAAKLAPAEGLRYE